MSVELREDMNVRELLDRCIQAELRGKVFEAQAKAYRFAMKTAMRCKTIEKARETLTESLTEGEGIERVLW